MTAPVLAAQSSGMTGDISGTTDITVTFSTDGPSGLAVGHLMLAAVSATEDSGTPPGIDTPSGWSLWRTAVCTTGSVCERLSLFSRLFQSGDTSVAFNATPNSGGSTKGITAKVIRITGQGSDWDDGSVAAADPGVQQSTIDAPSINTTVRDALVLCIVGGAENGIRTFSSPLSEQWDFGVDPGTSNMQTCGTKVQASPGATGAQTFTASGSTRLAAITAAVAPPLPGGGAPLLIARL